MKNRIRRLAPLLLLVSAALLAQKKAPPEPSQAALRSGPMPGYAELTEASVWLQTRRDAAVALRFFPEGKPGQARTTASVRANAANVRAVKLVASRLTPGTAYRYEVLLDGRPLSSPDWRFRTQAFWQYREPPPDFLAAFGSCYYANDPPSDRPGKPYGGDPAIFEKIADAKPDLMLWIGDNVYLREPDFGSAAAIFDRYGKSREEPRLQRLLASTRHYATWDDHDFGPNNAGWTYRHAPAALEAFRLFWPNPAFGHREIPGVFMQFSWADVDFFFLDDRWHRTPERALPAEKRRMLGPEQLRWLQDALLESSAPFKVIVNGSQVVNENSGGDSFANYPTEYRTLLDWIVANKVSGVVFLSGDRHISELLTKEIPGFYTLYDFTSSPLTAGSWGGAAEKNNPQRVAGTRIENSQAYGLLRFSGPCNDRVLTMEAYDGSGTKRWTHALKARDLYPPGTKDGDKKGHFGCRWLKTNR